MDPGTSSEDASKTDDIPNTSPDKIPLDSHSTSQQTSNREPNGASVNDEITGSTSVTTATPPFSHSTSTAPSLTSATAGSPNTSSPEIVGDTAPEMPQRPAVAVQAQGTDAREVDLRVRWADEVTPTAAPSGQPTNPPPSAPTAAPEPEEVDPHSLPEIQCQRPTMPNGMAVPASGAHNPANPAARPPSAGTHAPPYPIHIAAGGFTPVYFHQQMPLIIGQQPQVVITQQPPLVIHQQPPAIISNQPYLMMNPPFIGPAVQAPPVGTGSWCYPNWRQSPFHNGTAHWRTNPPIIVGQPGAQPVLLAGQPSNVVIYR